MTGVVEVSQHLWAASVTAVAVRGMMNGEDERFPCAVGALLSDSRKRRGQPVLLRGVAVFPQDPSRPFTDVRVQPDEVQERGPDTVVAARRGHLLTEEPNTVPN